MRAFRPVPRPTVPTALAIPEVALTQDGTFTRSQARAAGWSDERQRTLLRRGTWRRLAGSVLHHAETAIGPWQRARAVSLTGGLVVSHATAGALWGLQVDDSLHGIGHVKRLSTPIVRHRLPLGAVDRADVAGMVVTSPLRTITDLLCALPQQAAVGMATSALRSGMIRPSDLDSAARRATGRTGAPRARAMAESCRWGPHSFLEWRFHGLIAATGGRWRFNADLHDPAGFVGRVDAVHNALRVVVELDGRRFHGEDTFQSDRTRDQRLIAMGFVVLRFTWEDVDQRPGEVTARIHAKLRIREAQGARAA